MSCGGQNKSVAADGDLMVWFTVMAVAPHLPFSRSIDRTTPSPAANSHLCDRLNATASHPLDRPDVATAHRLRVSRFLIGSAQASEARLALLLELGDDLGISL